MQDTKVTPIPRMRNIKEAYRYLKENECGISEREIRRLAQAGKVPSIMAGRKILVNLDMLISHLQTHTLQPQAPQNIQGIRRID